MESVYEGANGDCDGDGQSDLYELLLGTPDLLGTARRGTRLGLVAGKGFVPFGTAAGMQYWFLEGALHGAMVRRPRRS